VKDCCAAPAAVAADQRRVLVVVLALNAAMFLVELGAGLLAGSTALLADSVDMLGDALVYGFSLWVVGRGGRWAARGALLKGVIMAAFGAGVLLEIVFKVVRGVVPSAEVMGGVGVLALAVNGAVLALLWRRRGDDVNMRSAWLCSRNDVLANAGVLVAAVAVGASGSAWPDIVVGLAIAGLFAGSALDVLRSARAERRALAAG
jgi:cation diffusion facilitator family transporter